MNVARITGKLIRYCVQADLTISQQIEFLTSQGLLVRDQALAYQALSSVSYYRLSSYLLPFKRAHQGNAPRQFKENATFEQIWQLYQFDRELRLLVVDAIEKIEGNCSPLQGSAHLTQREI